MGTKGAKESKRVKNLAAKGLTASQSKKIKGGGGKVQLQDLTITKDKDAASPGLFNK